MTDEYDSFNFDKRPHCQHVAELQWVSGNPCPRCSGVIENTNGDAYQWF